MTDSPALTRLRALMNTHQIDAYIIPTSDPHQSEYLASYWQSRVYFSGFTGSAATLIVTQKHAGLWTDSRYFLQAEKELKNTEVQLHKQLVPHAPEHIDWLCQNLPADSTVACDGMLFSVGQRHFLKNQLEKSDINLRSDIDLVSEAWHDRPALPKDLVFEFPEKYAGRSRKQKLEEVLQQMKTVKANTYLVTTLDDIAWVLNLRGSDIRCNPVFLGYLLISENEHILFIDPEKVPAAAHHQLNKVGIQIQAYDTIKPLLRKLPKDRRVLINQSTISWTLYHCIDPELIVKGENLCAKLKASKNETEVQNIRIAMRKDGVALTRLYRWLDEQLTDKTITEVEVATKLAQLREAQGNYFGESFDAIVGYKGNGAIVHYRPKAEDCAEIKKEGILLLDSGGQYLEGTTDITRTITLGVPTAEQKQHYTLVLKGHIAVATVQFPEGTTGVQLDTLARMYLWKAGLNYGHGTGHGVGHFLNVHEGPQGFAPTPKHSRASTAFEEGMLTSNEPGFYKTDAYGIRIENLILCRKAKQEGFLCFESLSLFPIDQALIDLALLTKEEVSWLNEYHQKVFTELSSLLLEEEKQWLSQKCQPIIV